MTGNKFFNLLTQKEIEAMALETAKIHKRAIRCPESVEYVGVKTLLGEYRCYLSLDRAEVTDVKYQVRALSALGDFTRKTLETTLKIITMGLP